MKNLLITGGCGFIGSHLVRKAKQLDFDNIVVLDNMTYAAINAPDQLKRTNLCVVDGVQYIKDDISIAAVCNNIITAFDITHVINAAAETHVDNSIVNAKRFISTNVLGTLNLLNACVQRWKLPTSGAKSVDKLFLQVSTDEVYGSVPDYAESFSEGCAYNPSNPYAASKAGADHLVDSFANTYNIPTVITHCCNNYGFKQHPEKLIPKTITNILKGKPIPIYGDGEQIRQWIHVEDHVDAIFNIVNSKNVNLRGLHLNIGTDEFSKSIDLKFNHQTTNNDLIAAIRHSVRKLRGIESSTISVDDRLGHDRRYHIDDSLFRSVSQLRNKHTLESSITDVVRQYIENYEQSKAN